MWRNRPDVSRSIASIVMKTGVRANTLSRNLVRRGIGDALQRLLCYALRFRVRRLGLRTAGVDPERPALRFAPAQESHREHRAA